MRTRLKSARNDETFVTRAAAREPCRTWEKGGKREVSSPLSLCFVLSFSDRGEWLTFRRPRRCSSGRKRLPSKYWFARPRNARVATRRIEGGFLPDVFVQAFRFRSSPNRISPEIVFLLGAIFRQVFLRIFWSLEGWEQKWSKLILNTISDIIRF